MTVCGSLHSSPTFSYRRLGSGFADSPGPRIASRSKRRPVHIVAADCGAHRPVNSCVRASSPNPFAFEKATCRSATYLPIRAITRPSGVFTDLGP
jgi:hypothetical protein